MNPYNTSGIFLRQCTKLGDFEPLDDDIKDDTYYVKATKRTVQLAATKQCPPDNNAVCTAANRTREQNAVL